MCIAEEIYMRNSRNGEFNWFYTLISCKALAVQTNEYVGRNRCKIIDSLFGDDSFISCHLYPDNTFRMELYNPDTNKARWLHERCRCS